MARDVYEISRKIPNPALNSKPTPLIVTKKQALAAILFGLVLSFPAFVRLGVPEVPGELLPPVHVLMLWALPLFILSNIRNALCHLISVVWILWFVVGSVNMVASYEYYGSYYLLDATFPAFIYILFVSVFLAGVWLYEKARVPRGKRVVFISDQLRNLDPVFSILLMLFPFLWFSVLYASLGYVPLINALQGKDLVTTLYTLDYGPMYGYALVNALAMLVVLERSRKSKGIKRWFYVLILAVFVFISISTGKRDWMVLFLLAALVYLLRAASINVRKVIALLAVLVALYVTVEIIRQGTDLTRFPSVSASLLITGHEYRTFAYVVNHVEPGTINGYDWGVSTIAAGLNSTLLRWFGFDKQALVEASSAYSWRYIFSSDLGIRSGIIGELYMAYGFSGSVILLMFGIMVGWVSTRIGRTRSKNALVFLSLVYATMMLEAVDTAANMTGNMTVILYVWLCFSLVRIFERQAHLIKAPIKVVS